MTAAASSSAVPPRRRNRGGLVTVGTVLALVAGMGMTVLGLGTADQAVASYDAASWMWSRAKGEVARVNGVTARVDTRVDVPMAGGRPMQVSQTDRLLILRDVSTGHVSAMDLTSLKIAATAPTTAGLGVNVALHDDAAFVVDSVQGVVRQLDPRTLTPIGEPIRYPPGITGGAFDGANRLWIAVPSEGTVSAITPAPLPAQPQPRPQTGQPQTGQPQSGAPQSGQPPAAKRAMVAAPGPGPRPVRTLSVAAPNHDLEMSTLDSGVAVLDRTTRALTTIRGDEQRTTALPLAGPGSLPARSAGSVVPVTVPGDRHIYLVTDGAVRDFSVPGVGGALQPAVAWAGLVYCADEQTGVVHVFDASGRAGDSIDIKDAKGPLELEVRENHLFINAPNAASARVVDDRRQVRVVNKYADDVLGADPPTVAPDPPAPRKPRKPVVAKPGAPRNVRATAGNAEARVTWRAAAANGAEIVKYVVEGAGRTFQVGADQRAVPVTGLTNGETYRFTVHAVNARGAGPSRTSNPARPTSQVPDPPAKPTAQVRADGTVVIRWPAANGQGLDIKRYAVTAVSDGTRAPIGEADGTELVVAAGELQYGKQYAFTVVAVNERGAGSSASPVSDSVVPFTVPGEPGNVDAMTMGDKAGGVRVVWGPSADHGRPVMKYTVRAGGRSVDVAADAGQATLDSFGDGNRVAVEVRAVNQAGEGPPGAATATTVAPPKVTITGSSATTTTATVALTVDAGGGRATCAVTGGGRSASGSCSSLTLGGLSASTGYLLSVTARNVAGMSVPVTRQQATAAVHGIATCRNGADGDTATYCTRERPGQRNGNEIFEITRQDDDRQVGWVPNGTRLKAYCKKPGKDVKSYLYNRQKRSTWWIRVDYRGANYIPWAWLNLEGGDDLGVLPTC